MCGITGFIDYIHKSPSPEKTIVRMTDTLINRGPDSSGKWIDPEQGVYLGHRRLSVLDLSPLGHQPMESISGRYVLVFNGEIYNFRSLRTLLKQKGHSFRGDSDTEVILASFEEWGVDHGVTRLVGMFAFAVWDRQKKVLQLGRDRLGEKPLFYGWQNNTFLFASELKALRKHPDWQNEIDRNSLALFTRFCYVPTPYSIFKNIFKLQPGCILTVSNKDAPAHFSPFAGDNAAHDCRPISFWSPSQIVTNSLANPFQGSLEEAEEELETLLKDVIKHQMVADVPLGAFLSGGIDSSTIVALMQLQSQHPIRTFTIGFHEQEYNEAVFAKQVAEHLKTDHTELYVTPREARDVIPQLPNIYDEPFADASQVPTFILSRLTRSSVTVSLSGDGGDELFGGYTRYFWGRNIWQTFGNYPYLIRYLFASGLKSISPHIWDKIYGMCLPFIPRNKRQSMPGDKLHKLSEILPVHTYQEMYLKLVSHWKFPQDIVIQGNEGRTPLTDHTLRPHLNDLIHNMMYLDMVMYMPDDILVKVDRAAMAVSLETRVPFLDHRLVEFAWKLPLEMKIKNGQGKHILRKILYKYVPPDLIERPKIGFGIPIDSWLRGPLYEWAETLLSPARMSREGFFYPTPISKLWREHQSGKRNRQYLLWVILMFQSWKEYWDQQ